MSRGRRNWVSQELGCYHLISRITKGTHKFDDYEKDHLLKLLKCFSAGFFVDIHAFCIMGNHFHILATELSNEAKKANEEELLKRYRDIYGKNADPPAGSVRSSGGIIVDEDGGIERLRKRLGSVSRFIQEFKQTFSNWYNKRHSRKGYLWHERFRGIIIEKGEAQLSCSAYIDLNPVRAGIVNTPEEYRWSSMGMMARKPDFSKRFLSLNFYSFLNESTSVKNKRALIDGYRLFVYLSGGIEKKDKSKIGQEVINEVINCHGRMGIGDCLKYRVRNMSEGIAIGTHAFISGLQQNLGRRFICPRRFTESDKIFTTRVLRIKIF